MAKVLGNSGIVKADTYAIAEVTKFDITITPVIVSDVAIGDTWSESAAGTKSWSGTIECFYDVTDTNGQQSLAAGDEVDLLLYPEGIVVGKTVFTGSAIIGAVTKSVTKDSYVTVTFPFTGNGAVTETAYSE